MKLRGHEMIRRFSTAEVVESGSASCDQNNCQNEDRFQFVSDSQTKVDEMTHETYLKFTSSLNPPGS